ncbi:hypothetical protein ACTXNP_02375 [Pseudomonas helleri]|uniref:hypothetical protein n=1 Tax=Pseudomonas helleri TaxID=1608996 RepID=UPI003FCF96C3
MKIFNRRKNKRKPIGKFPSAVLLIGVIFAPQYITKLVNVQGFELLGFSHSIAVALNLLTNAMLLGVFFVFIVRLSIKAVEQYERFNREMFADVDEECRIISSPSKINLEKAEAKTDSKNKKAKEKDSWIDDLLDSDSSSDGGGDGGGGD